MTTRSAYLYRKLQRLEQRHRQAGLVVASSPPPVRWVRFALVLARVDLREHVNKKVRPSMTDIVWRPKRMGGPYRLVFRDVRLSDVRTA